MSEAGSLSMNSIYVAAPRIKIMHTTKINLPDIYTQCLRVQAPRARVYISGKPQVPML